MDNTVSEKDVSLEFKSLDDLKKVGNKLLSTAKQSCNNNC